jgi:hypothetical protein
MKSIRKNRRGGMAIEFALTAPIFFLMIFASIEFARVHMIQCAVENSAFEGARRGIIPGATANICKSTTENLLDEARLADYTVTVDPQSITPLTNEISVTVDVPITGENGFGITSFMGGRTMSKTIILPREQASPN